MRDHVIQGLYSRDLAMYALGRVHRDENYLMADILDWERVDSLRRSSAKAERPTKAKDTVKYYTGPRNQSSSDTQSDKKTWRRAVPIEQKTNFETSGQQDKTSDYIERGSCFNCHKVGHLSRDCPTKRKPTTCYNCGVVGHMRNNFPNLQQVNAVVEQKSVGGHHPYQKIGVVNGHEFIILLDTGSHFTLLKSTVAIKCGLNVHPSAKPLYGVGSTVVPALETVGEALADIVVDGVNARSVVALVVPDDVQRPDIIVARNWLDSPAVAYHKAGGQLVLTEANVVNKLSDTTTVMSLDSEFDCLHVVSAETEVVRATLSLDEFKYVDEDAKADETTKLQELVDEYRDCFAAGLEELGCTSLVEMDIVEVPGSKPVVCRPYKTTAADRAEIDKIVSDWKRCGLVTETRSTYASPVILVKQSAGKHRLCVDYRRLNKQTLRQHFP